MRYVVALLFPGSKWAAKDDEPIDWFDVVKGIVILAVVGELIICLFRK